MKSRALKEAIKEDQERRKLAAEVEWTTQAIDFIKAYSGEHPILRSLHRQAKQNPSWVPSERQVIQIHRIVHRERISSYQSRQQRDSLGRRLRSREGPDLPTSLDEPDWI